MNDTKSLGIMKILIVFLDMIHTDHLNVYNNLRKDRSLDILFKRIGGTLYNRCYSPAPDTPRSNACIQTGLYPHFNGVDVRVKWPRDYINKDIDTFFDKAVDHGYHVNICTSRMLQRIGLLKFKNSESISYFNSLDTFLREGTVNENTLSYVADQDMHFALDDYGANEKGVAVGFEKIDILFRKYLTDEYLKKYDHIFFYSDHGAKLETDKFKTASVLNLLCDNRTRVLMFHHCRNSKGVTADARLACSLDLYSTITNLIGDEDSRQGYDLLSVPDEDRIIQVEDHNSFTVDVNLAISQWRIISSRYDIRTNIKETILDRGSENDINNALIFLREYSPSVKKIEDYYNFLNSYVDLKESKYYLVGGERLSKTKKRIAHFSHRLIHLFKR